MDDLESFLLQVHQAQLAVVLALTGGGTQAIGHLLSVPGGSHTILEAIVPYARTALSEFLGKLPESACSESTARAMAMASLVRARHLAAQEARDAIADAARRNVGIGCTASLVSDRPKRGQHRAYVAWQTEEETGSFSLLLEKQARSRVEEETLVARLVLRALGRLASPRVEPPLALRPVEAVVERRHQASPEWQALWWGTAGALPFSGWAASNTPGRVLMPGAFHPLHDGHRAMVLIAQRRLGRPVEFELSIENVDKPPLDYLETADRLVQFPAGAGGWLTRAATFVEKSRLFPGCVFIVGADTIERIGQPRYYGSPESAAQAVVELGERGCRFLVFGRALGGGFRGLADLQLPPALAALCEEVPEEEFRLDLSSTALRREALDRESGG